MKKLMAALALGLFIASPLLGMSEHPLTIQMTNQRELVRQGLERVRSLHGEPKHLALLEFLHQYDQSNEILVRLILEQIDELEAAHERLVEVIEEANSMGLIPDESRNARIALYAGFIGTFTYIIYQWYKEYKAKKHTKPKKISSTPIVAK